MQDLWKCNVDAHKDYKKMADQRVVSTPDPHALGLFLDSPMRGVDDVGQDGKD